MRFKIFFQTLFILLIINLSYIHSEVCRTQEGEAWCENSKCYYRAGGTFTGNYCRAASSDGILKFNGSNCRKCPLKSCAIVTELYTGSLNVYHNANGYFLTIKGWCYYGN